MRNKRFNILQCLVDKMKELSITKPDGIIQKLIFTYYTNVDMSKQYVYSDTILRIKGKKILIYRLADKFSCLFSLEPGLVKL